MIDPEAQAEALAAQIAANLDADRINVYAMPEGDPELPAIIVYADSPFVTYRRTFGSRGIAEVRFRVEVRVAVGEDAKGATSLMYAIAGTSNEMSLFDAIGVDATLGGAVASCVAESFTEPREAGDPARPYLVSSIGVTTHEPRSQA